MTPCRHLSTTHSPFRHARNSTTALNSPAFGFRFHAHTHLIWQPVRSQYNGIKKRDSNKPKKKAGGGQKHCRRSQQKAHNKASALHNLHKKKKKKKYEIAVHKNNYVSLHLFFFPAGWQKNNLKKEKKKNNNNNNSNKNKGSGGNGVNLLLFVVVVVE